MKEMRESASTRVISYLLSQKKQKGRGGGRGEGKGKGRGGGVDPQVSLSSQRDISLSPEKPSPCQGGTL